MNKENTAINISIFLEFSNSQFSPKLVETTIIFKEVIALNKLIIKHYKIIDEKG